MVSCSVGVGTLHYILISIPEEVVTSAIRRQAKRPLNLVGFAGLQPVGKEWWNSLFIAADISDQGQGLIFPNRHASVRWLGWLG